MSAESQQGPNLSAEQPQPEVRAIAAPPQVVRYYTLLRNYTDQSRAEKAGYLNRAMEARVAWSAGWPDGWRKPARSPSTFRTHAREVRLHGVRWLQRKQRTDKGASRSGLDEQLAAIWQLLIAAPSTSPLKGPVDYFVRQIDGQWTVIDRDTGGVVEVELVAGRLHYLSRADAIREFRDYLCPGARDIPKSAFERVARQMNEALRLSTKERRNSEAWIGYPEPSLGCWAVDASPGDLWVWDRIGDPYRPYLTVCIDQLSAMPMAILWTQEAPSNEVTRSLLLQAMYPKSETWNAQGFPLRIRSDFGFQTEWMHQLEATANAELGVELQLEDTIAPETPWANGHAEELIALVQQSLVRRFCARYAPAAYWGNKPENRPEWHRNRTGDVRVDRDDEQWRLSLPYPEQLREYTIEWVEELITRGVEGEDAISKGLKQRLGMSRGKFWQAKAAMEPHTVRTLPRELAEPWLMERGQATVRKGGVLHALGETYRHPDLVEHAVAGGGRVEIRYDLADITTVRCYTARGEHICDAVRTFQVRGAESKAEWGKHRHRMRQVTKAQREVIEEAARLQGPVATDETFRDLREVPAPKQPADVNALPWQPDEIVPDDGMVEVPGPYGPMRMPREQAAAAGLA